MDNTFQLGEAVMTGDMTLYDAFSRSARVHSDREAVVIDDTRVSYAELGERVDALAAGLYRMGLRRGHKVVLVLPSCLEFVYLYWAIAKLGAVFVPANPFYRRQEIGHILRDCQAEAVVIVQKWMGNDLWGIVQSLRDELPSLRHVIVRGDEAPEGAVSLNSLMTSSEPQPPGGQVALDDLFGLFYTSGTTGVPKASMHTHRSQIAQTLTTQKAAQARNEKPIWEKLKSIVLLTARYGLRYMRHGSSQRALLALQPLHASAGHGMMKGYLLDGSRFVAMERFDPVRALEMIERERASMLVATPSMYRIMLDVKSFDRYDKSSLLFAMSTMAYVPPKLAELIGQRFECPLVIAYGSSEAAVMSMTGLVESNDVATDSIGRAVGDVQLKITDADRSELPPGEVGEIAIKVPGQMVGYYNAPELTAEVLDSEGWYYTGDLGTVDENGVHRIVGRKKDMIIRGGQNVYPAEVENIILQLPDVQYAAVVGVPSELYGEQVWAYVVPKAGASLERVDVMEHCRAQLTAYKVPQQVRIVEALPRTATQKVQKFKLREMAEQEIAQRRGAAPV